MLLLAVVAYATNATSIQLSSGELTVSFEQDGRLLIDVNGKQWFRGYGYTFEAVLPDGSPQQSAGTDELGAYTSVSVRWVSANSSSSFVWITSIRAYSEMPTGKGVFMFRQEWPNGANMSPHTQVTSGWPTLGSALSSPQLGYLQYEGSSAGMMTKTGYFPSGITGGIAAGALAVSDKTDVVVMSQLNNFLGGGMDPVNASRAQGGYPAIAMGISGKYNRLPIGFSSEAVLVSESTAGSSSFGKPAGGFNRGITAWGDILLQRHGKARPSVKKSPADLTDLKANYLGYSTTAFYHHNECDGNSTTIPNCITWEDTLVAVNDDLKARGVPSKWMLIDSYWYGEDLFNGALLWEVMLLFMTVMMTMMI